jgi:hypothetical protein
MSFAKKTRIRTALIALCCSLLLISACSQSDSSPTAITGIDTEAKSGADPDFLRDLASAIDATTWEMVTLQQGSDGALIAYPSSFATGRFVRLEPLAGWTAPTLADSIQVRVAAADPLAPDGCIPFRIEGVPAGVGFKVRTYLPDWAESSRLESNHCTYQLVDDGDDLAIANLKSATTPTAPWFMPPIMWTVTVEQGREDDLENWVTDPGGDGDE